MLEIALSQSISIVNYGDGLAPIDSMIAYPMRTGSCRWPSTRDLLYISLSSTFLFSCTICVLGTTETTTLLRASRQAEICRMIEGMLGLFVRLITFTTASTLTVLSYLGPVFFFSKNVAKRGYYMSAGPRSFARQRPGQSARATLP